MKTIEKKASYEQPKMQVIDVKLENMVIITSDGDDEGTDPNVEIPGGAGWE